MKAREQIFSHALQLAARLDAVREVQVVRKAGSKSDRDCLVAISVLVHHAVNHQKAIKHLEQAVLGPASKPDNLETLFHLQVQGKPKIVKLNKQDTKTESLDWEPVDIPALVQESIQILQKQSQVDQRVGALKSDFKDPRVASVLPARPSPFGLHLEEDKLKFSKHRQEAHSSSEFEEFEGENDNFWTSFARAPTSVLLQRLKTELDDVSKELNQQLLLRNEGLTKWFADQMLAIEFGDRQRMMNWIKQSKILDDKSLTDKIE